MATGKTTNGNADSTGGFKTVAFGFDKNDVTMYIASLRKKMKQMEEEFQDKLSQALENPTASNEALKHEREVIRSEMEKMWGDKLNERNSILKQQQAQIRELERRVNEDKEIIASLKTQLSAATSESDTDSAVLSARAAKAYMQFTAELRSMSDSIAFTLDTMEKNWRGEFEDEIQAISAAAADKAASAPSTAEPPKAAVHNAGSADTTEKTDSVPAENVPTASAPAVRDAANRVEEKSEEKVGAASEPKAEKSPKTQPAEVKKETPAEKEKPSRKEARETKRAISASKKAASQAEAKPAEAPVPTPAPAPAKPFVPSMSFDGLLIDDDDPLKGIIADISEETPRVAFEEAPSSPAAETKPVEKAKEVSVPTVKDEVKVEDNEPEPVKNKVEDELSGGFDDLLAADDLDDDMKDLLSEPVEEAKPESASVPAPAAPKPAPAASMDNDLSSLLADISDETDIKPIDNTVGATDDFADLLADMDKDDSTDDFFITGDDNKISKGDDLDVGLLSDIVIDPNNTESNGDLGEMIRDREAKELAELGGLFVSPADESNAPDFSKAASENARSAKHEKEEEDLFDFSFISDGDSEDEDDMSTDASFPGML